MGKPALETLTTRNAIYKGQLKKVARKYRDKIRINNEAVIDTYKKEERAPFCLGRIRHGNNLCNYDELVSQVQDKYADTNLAFCNEIIHSICNHVNDKIVQCIIQAEREGKTNVKSNG